MIHTFKSLALAVILATASGTQIPSFAAFVKQFGKPYQPGTTEWAVHEKAFHENVENIIAHNARYENGKTSYFMGVNEFTDMTNEEKRTYLGYSGPHTAHFARPSRTHKPGSGVPVRHSLDWRRAGITTPVKNQGKCGSCWAFASTAVMESHLALDTGVLNELSTQQLVDCAPNVNACGGFGGCEGSTATLAFDYIMDAQGQSIHWAYPYLSYWYSVTDKVYDCRWSYANLAPNDPVAATRGAVLDGYVRVQNNSVDAMLEAVNLGPVAINVDASVWHEYQGGVFDGCQYDDIDINHVVVLVGYGTDDATGLDYWLIRNSWGPSWGESGYIRLRRQSQADLLCGPDYAPEDGTECEGGDSVIEVCGECGMLWDAAYPTRVHN